MRDGGFTLIETLAALAVFSIAAMSILHLSGENAKTAGLIERRAMSAIVADNQLAALRLQDAPHRLGQKQGEVVVAEQEWVWRQQIRQTADDGIWEVVIEAGQAPQPQTPFVSLVERRMYIEADQ